MFDLTGIDEIQRLDLEIDELDQGMATHREKIARLEAEVHEEEALIGKKQALEKKIVLRKKANETEMAALNERLTLIGVRLKSPGVSPAQYEALQKEADGLKGPLSVLETKVLEDMEKLQLLEADIPKRQKVLEGRRAQVVTWNEKHSAEIRRLEAERERVATERRQLSMKLGVQTLEVYEELRRRHKGRVVFDATAPVCPACGMNIPKSDLNRMVGSADAGHRCTNCSRLLRWRGDASALE